MKNFFVHGNFSIRAQLFLAALVFSPAGFTSSTLAAESSKSSTSQTKDWISHHEEMARLHQQAVTCLKDGKKNPDECNSELRTSMMDAKGQCPNCQYMVGKDGWMMHKGQMMRHWQDDKGGSHCGW